MQFFTTSGKVAKGSKKVLIFIMFRFRTDITQKCILQVCIYSIRVVWVGGKQLCGLVHENCILLQPPFNNPLYHINRWSMTGCMIIKLYRRTIKSRFVLLVNYGVDIIVDISYAVDREYAHIHLKFTTPFLSWSLGLFKWSLLKFVTL